MMEIHNFNEMIDSSEFKVFENFILRMVNLYTNKLADNKVIDTANMEFIYCNFLEYQGIRTGLRVWLNLISFIKALRYRKKRNQRYIIEIQSFIKGLKMPLIWLYHRRKENRRTSEPTKSEQVGNNANLGKVAEALLGGQDGGQNPD